jgi:cold shock CspA family protein
VIEGVVEAFDDRRGYGLVRDGDGDGFFLHCVDIADGTRTIAVGTRVSGERRVGRLGRDEVARVAPVR